MLRDILIVCRTIDQMAEKAYRTISSKADVNDQKLFWREICKDEQRHIAYWEQLLRLEKAGTLQNPFDDSEQVLAELNVMKETIGKMSKDRRWSSDFSESILWAFRLESFLLHPAFGVLFHVLRAETGGVSPEDDYQDHIEKFMQAVRKYLGNKPEMLLIGEILSTSWARSKELAIQYARIKTLNGLIRICASCKQVRTDKGYWEQIEAYVRRHSEAKFSHGICPECAQKLYSENL